VSDGLARHAERHGMSAFVAELVAGANGPTLVPRAAAEGARETFAVDLNGGAAPGELSGWLERAAAGSDLVLLEGPPLAQSIDAALLACACDGLVIVADAEVTPRAALHVAAERAQIAGCRTFGVVMTGTKDRTPTWMRRLLGNDERAPRRGGA
jgi:Mrp family chromosome partitioning ATPase